ncbi:MAG: Zn-dependent hydrolase [Deltaproteobacteria bacterium]|nr:Zn-dependent hydrolase [Deltaproteobacteria bacterium]
MKVRIDRIARDIEIINSFTSTPGRGITRFTFSEPYMQARAYLAEELQKIGARVATTPGGNLCGRIEGGMTGLPSVMTGSHIDSVLHGGRFDGVAGVVAALEAARVMAEEKPAHRHPVDVVVFAEEEGSRFGSVMIGSRAWIGKLTSEDLNRLKDQDGVSYAAAMADAGIAPEAASLLRPGMVKAMIELHIEQSLVLESKGLSIGVVEGINGIKQFAVSLTGVSNHAGATPMGLRHDALQGAARVIAAVEEIAVQEPGATTVATVGVLTCEPGQANVIPGKVRFTLDIRDLDSGRIDQAARRIMSVIQKTCQDRGLAFDIQPRSDTPPVRLSKEVVRLIETTAREKGIKTLRMPSGALHDSSILPEVTEVGMIFVPSKAGRSHCPEEETNLEDIGAGAELLLGAVAKLAS